MCISRFFFWFWVLGVAECGNGVCWEVFGAIIMYDGYKLRFLVRLFGFYFGFVIF